ncbi:MAG TPA: ABC transporter permease [Anaerolineae bacterium]|nr:ABC transporter permease [Anaerolineae bacterium]
MLRPRWRKVLADLYGKAGRTILVVASIAVGVFAIGVIAGTYVIIDRDLAESYGATDPANIKLITTPFDRGFADAVATMDGVHAAEGRRHAQLQLRLPSGDWDAITLIAARDDEPMTIHRQRPVEAQSLPAERTVVLEHKSLANLGAQTGDVLEIELPDGTLRQLPVIGTVQDQSDVYGSILGDLQGFITYDTLEWLGQPLSLDRLYVVVESGDDEGRIREIAAEITDRVEKAGGQVYRTSIAVGDEHPLASIVSALLSVLVILGVLVVFLSGSLIANTMSALLNQHTRQVGVMKLVGARRRQIGGMYVALILSFGGIALIASVPLGSWGAYALSRFVARIMNFQVQGFRIIPAAVVLQVVIALLVPPAAGLLPVLRGSRVTVRQALSSTGLAGASSRTGWLDRALTRLRGVSRPTLISIRNTFRHKGRLALTLFTLTLGGAVFIAVFNAQVALNGKMGQISSYFGADVNLDFVLPYRVEEVVGEARAIDGVTDVEVWLSSGGELVRAGQATTDPVAVLAPPADSALVDPTVLHGRWLLPGDENAIVVNEAFLDDLPDLQVGDALRLKIAGRERDWIVVGIFQYTGMDDLVVYANYGYLARLVKAGNHASVYRIVTAEHSLAFQERVGEQLNEHFRALGYRVANVEAGEAYNASVTKVLGILTAVLVVMALLTALVGSIGLTGTMSMNVLERTREIGVMRALGAHNRIIAKLVVMEGLLIGLISYALGAVLSFPITFLLSNVISLAIFGSSAAFAFTVQGFGIWLTVVAGLSVLASILPARTATQLTIREVLAYE